MAGRGDSSALAARRLRRRGLVALIAAVATVLAAASPAAATGDGGAPWKSAEAVRGGLFDAQTELILGDGPAARRAAQRAAGAYAGELRAGIRTAAPDADAGIRRTLRAARRAVTEDDEPGLAAARGTLQGALFRGAMAVTLGAVRAGDVATARAWLLLREFRTATRLTRPGADATLAVRGLERRRIDPRDAAEAVNKDLLDAYQGRQRDLLADADAAAERKLPTRLAESAAQAAAYWPILSARYAEDRGQAAADALGEAFARLAAAGRAGDVAGFKAARRAVSAGLESFTAAPLTADESARRAQQLLRFLALVPVEYGRGVKDTRVTLDFEIQEAVAFHTGAAAALADLQDQLAKRDPARAAAVKDRVDELGDILGEATERKDGVRPADDVEALTNRIEDDLAATMPEEWQQPTDESDYDLIALTLDRLEAAVGAQQYQQAEQARLEAYAFFEFGPERRLKSFDPGLATDVEGLVWFGAGGVPGLADLIADRAPRREVHETRLALDEKLADAAATLGDSANKATIVTNSAIIVFREGLEAVLILAAITASFVGVRRRMRRPVLVGAALGLTASSFSPYCSPRRSCGRSSSTARSSRRWSA